MIVWLARQVLHEMHEQESALHPLETGGVLMGWRSESQRVVVHLLGPGPRALHGRHMFLPDHEWHVGEIRRAFGESNGDIDYLGDWHSHPDGVAEMSSQDRVTLRRISGRAQEPLMLIIAGGDHAAGWSESCWYGLRTWRYLYPRFDVETCDLRVFDPPSEWLIAGKKRQADAHRLGVDGREVSDRHSS